MMNPYKQTDRAIKAINQQIVRLFEPLRGMMAFDELNVMGKTKEIYTELESVTVSVYEQLTKLVYDTLWVWMVANGWAKEADKPSRNPFDKAEIVWFLQQYDLVTKYVYTHELERKQARLAEAILASYNAADRATQIQRAMNLVARMVAQYAVTVTDWATRQAYIDAGVQYVQWITVPDERRCKECKARHGKVYPIDKVPPKPHYNCRCRLIPYRKGGNADKSQGD